MQLLVSVADASEAHAALLGGADVIDAKDPRQGALGAVRQVVLGAYADWARAHSLAPEPLVALAADTDAAGVLLDTAFKPAGLFALLDTRTVGAWIAAAHDAGLFACLAGSLGGRDFAAARALGADLVGVRGAACVGGRSGRNSRARVAGLSARARSARR